MIVVELVPSRLSAAAGSDVDGDVIVRNEGDAPRRLMVTLAGEASGWGSIEPGLVDLAAGEEMSCELRFRLPRGAPGGSGPVPFAVRAIPDEPGEVETVADGSVEVLGESELALRLLPFAPRGALSAHTRLAVDNLGSTPARAVLAPVPNPDVTIEVEPDSVVVDPGTTEFVKVVLRPVRRMVTGPPRRLPFRVRAEPLGGAPVSTEGALVQRSLVAGVGPRAVALVVVLALAVFGLSRVLGGDGDEAAVLEARARSSTTVTTAAPTTTLPPVETTVSGQPPPPVPVAERRIAFQSKRDGNFEIYSVSPDGKESVNLTNHPGHDGEPAWSPDGHRLAFDSDRAGTGFDIYVMNRDGTNVVPLTVEPAADGYPSWSPDGKTIAFVSLRDGNSEIYVMNADGTGAKRLTRNLADDARPTWSPDGTKILFSSNVGGNYDLYAVNADGTGTVNLTNHPAADHDPTWSRDGKRIVFTSTRDTSDRDVWIMNADGTEPRALVVAVGPDVWPVYSADGRRIVFQSARDGDPELYSISERGGTPVRLTSTPGIDGEPSW